MDQKELEEKIKEAFLRLPSELQEVVGNGKWIEAVTEIVKKNGLDIPKMGQVQNEVMLVLLGIIHPDKFLWDIKDSLKLPNEKMEKIIKEISEAVFIPIREKLNDVYIKNTTEEEPTQTMAPGEKKIFDNAGISIEGEKSVSSTPIKPTENRADLLKGIENPTKSTPTVLNESKSPLAASSFKSAVRDMSVPIAPYAKEQTPSTAPITPKPASTGPVDIMAGKLGGSFTVPKKETDYSIKNISGAPASSTAPAGDTYREPIE